MGLQVIEKETQTNGIVYQVAVVVIHQGLIVLVSDDKLAIGSIAIATSPVDPTLMSAGVFPVIGAKNEYSAKVIGERIARTTKKLVLTSVRLKQESFETLQIILNLLDQALEEIPKE
ncbi:MAG: hypothetical protein ACW976_02540 [Candidatus Ranarchaeia archaeon]|jgi:hypothetical protein